MMELVKLALEAAPTFASAFLSPAAGIALHLVSDAFQSKDATPENLMTAVQNIADPTKVNSILADLETRFGPMLKPLLTGNRPSNLELTIKVTWPSQCST